MYKGVNPSIDMASEDAFYNDEDTAEAFCEPSFEERFFDREKELQISRMVNKYLEQLPPRQKVIVYQKFYLGLSYAEIAKAGGISVNTVYNTVYAAMDKLRSIIPSSSVISLVSLLAGLCSIIFLK